jgi:hypothetical protein
MYAEAYMGAKRRGAALPRFCQVVKRLRPRARVLARGVKALEEPVFGPCTQGRTWGTRPETNDVVGRSNPPEPADLIWTIRSGESGSLFLVPKRMGHTPKTEMTHRSIEHLR